MAHVSAVLLIFLLLSLQVIAEENEPNIIQLGSSLYPGKHPSSWPSSSGQFEFGFYRQGNGYAVGIWLVGQPENTVVWTANRDDPSVSLNATLIFTRHGNLLLRTEDGKEKLIASNLEKSADSATMLDTGNFVLYSEKAVIWESFDFPTDTILGGQNLSVDNELISSVSRSNHSTGRYFLSMQNDGNLVAYVNNSAEVDSSDSYWDSYTSGTSFYVLNLNKRGVLRLLYDENSKPKVLASVNSSGVGNQRKIIYRATLDLDGIFRIYSHHFESNSSSSTVTKEWQNLNDQCDVKGHCGLNSYCSGRGNDVECYCYPGFTFIKENMKFLGCSQNFTEDGCEERKSLVMLYNFSTLENMIWAYDPYSVISLKMEDCKNACEEDCYCGAVLYSSGNCNKYKLPLKYGRRSQNILTTAFIKLIVGSTTDFSPSIPSSPIVINENKGLISTLGISLGSIACLGLVAAISSFFIYRHRTGSHGKHFGNQISGLTERLTLQSFSYDELDRATGSFKEELGRGSFGAVYKGILRVDNRTIAVKKLENFDEGEREFRAEIKAIARTNHRNLVRLLGFCVEGGKKLLVYEYLSNGSLADFLFKATRRPIWKERVRIALDVAKGILYLHEECEFCIIHCNIKPRNILMDDVMTAKISDFGLAKVLMRNQSSITGIRETREYSAPEWQRNALISVKVDVYSFGMVLLEIICCRSSIELQVSTSDEILLSTWVYNCFVAGELNKLVEGQEVDMKMLERMVKVGLWCIQDDPILRPSTKNVVLMLEGTMDVPIPPSPSLSHVS